MTTVKSKTRHPSLKYTSDSGGPNIKLFAITRAKSSNVNTTVKIVSATSKF